MQIIAHKNGGECLSKEYINNRTKLSWKCAYNHLWDATPDHIKCGEWCPRCVCKGQTIEDMQKLASKKGGKCLSVEYTRNEIKLNWQCELGHTWFDIPSSIKMGRWCPICSSNVSERITNAMFEHLFGCKFDKIKPTWLINDAGNKMELDGYNDGLKIAFEYQGIQHYRFNARFHQDTSLKKRMEDDSLKKRLCKKHNIVLIEIPYTVNYEELFNFILAQCEIKKIDTQNKSKLDYHLLNAFSPKNLEEIKKIAEEKGGKCLSEVYINKNTKLSFECAKGHSFESRPETIKRGQWCFKCAHEKLGESKRLSIEYFRDIVAKRRGVLLSETYLSTRIKLKIKCERGHTWMAVPSTLQAGNWCPECYDNRRGNSLRQNISVFQKIAELRCGKCLSPDYPAGKTHLKFQCSWGHIWDAAPRHIKAGHWCPKCARIKK